MTGQWNGQDTKTSSPEVGASGSGLLDKLDENLPYADKLIAVESQGYDLRTPERKMVFTLLQNAWNNSLKGGYMKVDDLPAVDDLTIVDGLRKFLDPKDTWVSNVEGGYINDLRKNSTYQKYELPLDPGKSYKFDRTLNIGRFYILDYNIKAKEHISFEEHIVEDPFHQKVDDGLGHGFAFADNEINNSFDVSLNVSLSKIQDIKRPDPIEISSPPIIYSSEYKSTGRHRLMTNESNEQVSPRFLCTDCQSATNASKDMKGNLTNAITAALKRGIRGGNVPFQDRLSDISATFNFEIKQSGLMPHRVRAIRVPMLMPENAVQVFDEPDAMIGFWHSEKDPSSRGKESNSLYIDKIVEEEGLIVGSEKEIVTGDNGGYLNLVNRNFKFSVKAGLTSETKKKFNIYVKGTKTNSPVYYKVWSTWSTNLPSPITDDFYPIKEVITHGEIPPSLLGGERSESPEIEIPIPSNDEAQLTETGRPKYLRIRIAVSSADLTNSKIDDVIDFGEVEDYLLEVVFNDGGNGGDLKQSKNDKEVIAEHPIVFPNPVADVFNLFIGAKKPSPLHLTIYDLAGKLVYEKNVTILQKGNKILTFRDFKLNASTYILKIKSDDLNWSTKLIVK